jgi:hypothetical protein
MRKAKGVRWGSSVVVGGGEIGVEEEALVVGVGPQERTELVVAGALEAVAGDGDGAVLGHGVRSAHAAHSATKRSAEHRIMVERHPTTR